jgi:hypothetical protein
VYSLQKGEKQKKQVGMVTDSTEPEVKQAQATAKRFSLKVVNTQWRETKCSISQSRPQRSKRRWTVLWVDLIQKHLKKVKIKSAKMFFDDDCENINLNCF